MIVIFDGLAFDPDKTIVPLADANMHLVEVQNNSPLLSVCVGVIPNVLLNVILS